MNEIVFARLRAVSLDRLRTVFVSSSERICGRAASYLPAVSKVEMPFGRSKRVELMRMRDG